MLAVVRGILYIRVVLAARRLGEARRSAAASGAAVAGGAAASPRAGHRRGTDSQVLRAAGARGPTLDLLMLRSLLTAPSSPRHLALLWLAAAACVTAGCKALDLPVYPALLGGSLVLLRVLDGHVPMRAPGKATGLAASRAALEKRADVAVPDAIRLAERLQTIRDRAAEASDTLFAQRATDSIDCLRRAKDRVMPALPTRRLRCSTASPSAEPRRGR